MNKNKKHLAFYTKCMETGKMPMPGLCYVVDDKRYRLDGEISAELLTIMSPTAPDLLRLRHDGLSTSFWASGFPNGHQENMCYFTPLRQTVVLFMAAMNNEL